MFPLIRAAVLESTRRNARRIRKQGTLSSSTRNAREEPAECRHPHVSQLLGFEFVKPATVHSTFLEQRFRTQAVQCAPSPLFECRVPRQRSRNRAGRIKHQVDVRGGGAGSIQDEAKRSPVSLLWPPHVRAHEWRRRPRILGVPRPAVPADVPIRDSALPSLLQVRPKSRVATLELLARQPAIQQKQPAVEHGVAVHVAPNLILGKVPGARKDRPECLPGQLSARDLFFLKDEELVVTCGKAALDAKKSPRMGAPSSSRGPDSGNLVHFRASRNSLAATARSSLGAAKLPP